MKKLLSATLCFTVCILSTMLLTACGGSGNTTLPDFKDCEIGYQLEVYPKVAFSYKINDECIVHIESISATLTAKNEINEGDILEKSFYPFEVFFVVTGTISTNNVGENLSAQLDLNSDWVGVHGTINSDGTFTLGAYTRHIRKNGFVYFAGCSLSSEY